MPCSNRLPAGFFSAQLEQTIYTINPPRFGILPLRLTAAESLPEEKSFPWCIPPPKPSRLNSLKTSKGALPRQEAFLSSPPGQHLFHILPSFCLLKT